MLKLRILFLFIIICFSIPSLKAEERVQDEKVTVILDWFLNASHESLLAAQYSGAFKRHHLNVQLIAPADTGIPPRLVAAGQADIAISYPVQLGMMIDHHIPLVRIGALVNQPLNLLIANKDIQSLRDLKGKKIGVSVAGDEQSVLKTMLRYVGLELSDVQVINVNFQLEQALMTGAVDAILGAARNYELLDLQQRHVKVNSFKPEEYGVPSYDEMIFVTRPELAKAPKIKRFMQALKEGTAYLQKHSDEIFTKTIQDHSELNTPLNKQSWQVTLSFLPADPVQADKERYQKFLDFLSQQNIVHQTINFSDFVVSY